MSPSDIRSWNRDAWDRQVAAGQNQWTKPVSPDITAAAARGEWQIVLTPQKPVPRPWFGPAFPDIDVLCLASGGGQQGPILAAAGACVTVFDNSPAQLAQDRMVADRDSLSLLTVEGDAADLSAFPNESFDLIVHPVSNVFMPELAPVWRECHRVLRPGGALLAGMCYPMTYIFDAAAEEKGELIVRHALPYSDLANLSADERKALFKDAPVEFSHTLEEQIGGQTDAGFLLAGFYEDNWSGGANRPLSRYMPCFFATRAVK
jgi:SAM-dependent methyltransferase